jgi:hypothetical protein
LHRQEIDLVFLRQTNSDGIYKLKVKPNNKKASITQDEDSFVQRLLAVERGYPIRHRVGVQSSG